MLTATVGLNEAGTQEVCASQGLSAPGCWDRVLYVRTTCGDQSSEITCSDDDMDYKSAETVTIPVTAGSTYYFFVDAYTASDIGDFSLKLTLQ